MNKGEIILEADRTIEILKIKRDVLFRYRHYHEDIEMEYRGVIGAIKHLHNFIVELHNT